MVSEQLSCVSIFGLCSVCFVARCMRHEACGTCGILIKSHWLSEIIANHLLSSNSSQSTSNTQQQQLLSLSHPRTVGCLSQLLSAFVIVLRLARTRCDALCCLASALSHSFAAFVLHPCRTLSLRQNSKYKMAKVLLAYPNPSINAVYLSRSASHFACPSHFLFALREVWLTNKALS